MSHLIESVSIRQTRRYGWRPSRPDHRDLVYRLPRVTMPPSVPPITHYIGAYDQGQLGSCTGNGISRLFANCLFSETNKLIMPSRLFIYWFERFMEGTVKQDAGAEVRDGLKVVAKYGVPTESLWPYNIKRFVIKPSKAAIAAAKTEIALEYQAVTPTVDAIKTAIANHHPVVGGFAVPESFEGPQIASNGIMQMPKHRERFVGGHCVLWDGYNDDGNGYFWCPNSWGKGWGCAPDSYNPGARGWFKMPYDFIKNCSDMWVLTKVSVTSQVDGVMAYNKKRN